MMRSNARRTAFLLISLAAQASTTGATNARNLTYLAGDPGQRCMDGTPSGYYFHKGKGDGAKKWVLTLQGGGECVKKSSCDIKAKSALGSSHYFPKTYAFFSEAADHFSDASCKGNPVLCDYNQVFLPYCSQDLWSGTKTDADATTYGYLFSGHLIFSAVLDALDAAEGMTDATEIVLTGDSAGGFGVYNNVDWLAARYSSARVVGAPIAGFEFYAWPYRGPGHTSSSLADFSYSAMSGGAYNKLWGSMVPTKCAAAKASEPGACLLPGFSYPYIDAPLFIIEAQSDSVVLMYHDWVPQIKRKSQVTAPLVKYFSEFQKNQSQFLASAMSSTSVNGVFNPSCFIHTKFDKSITIAGLNYLEAFLQWKNGSKVKLMDTCADGKVLCNPSCPL